MWVLLLVILVLAALRIYSHQQDCTGERLKIIQTLTRQCARWLVAALQDESPMIAVLHVQYGMGYLWAVKDIATTKEFKQATGLDMLEFEEKAKELQDKVTRRTAKACPQFASHIDEYMGRAAGDL